jgi:hypothetical protein
VIAKDDITAWRLHAPWISDHQVEQDLVISRALAQIFGVAEIGRPLLCASAPQKRQTFDQRVQM